jgi:uncharacterized protein (DUF2236 family)
MIKWFVEPDSIVRKIWGDADVVLLIFVGGAAEFALNRAVDWLFFTNKLPSDPIGRFFSTVGYAQEIVFAEEHKALQTLQRINAVHSSVERKRGDLIPDWANRDVLYLLIDYSQRAFELARRPLTHAEQDELYQVFHRVGTALNISQVPQDYADWQQDRERHLAADLVYSPYTDALYAAYRRDLSWWRYTLLLQLQAMLVPETVRQLLQLPRRPWLRPAVALYPFAGRLGLRTFYQRALIPPKHLPAAQRLQLLTPSAAPIHPQ